jgi:predicted transcriptional regulator
VDTYSAAETARLLGTTVPRIKRAITDLDMNVPTGRHGRVALRPAQVKQLASRLGVSEAVSGLSRLEVQVLAALARAPLGLVSTRAVARRAAVSPTAAGRTLAGLIARGLVRHEREWIAAGRATERDVYRAAFDAPEWSELAGKLARVRLPRPPAAKSDRRVPAHLRHLFWTTAPSQLDTTHAGSYIARRLLSTGDLSGIAWGSANLDPAAWESAARARGLDPSQRALALNLAHKQKTRR